MHEDPTDPLSSLGRKLLRLDPAAYSALVPSGAGNAVAKDLLESTQPADLVAEKVARPDDARAMLSGLWLYFDWLDESHRISQALESPTGSFWHAIMHRRERDFSNSKYWYARSPNHPVLAALGANGARLVNNMAANKSLLRLIVPSWSPAAFVDLVEKVHDQPADPRHTLAVTLQKLEWQFLFEHCTRSAAGR